MANFIDKKIGKICADFGELIVKNRRDLTALSFVESDYKTGNTPPTDGYKPFLKTDHFYGVDKHFWIKFSVDVPESDDSHRCFLSFRTGREGQWDATNPQGIIYIDGELTQGVDINHTEVYIKPGKHEINYYYYTGMIGGEVGFSVQLLEKDTRIQKVYYDIFVPYYAAMCLKENDDNRILMLRELDRAVNLIDLRVPYSESFYGSLKQAEQFLETEFYEKYCGKNNTSTVNCIGHTHIDVAWLWTLSQTREKAQRSFSTVLHLMEQYPEYKFMSSQPQLYEYVKEEVPELYEKIKARIREGRWDPEGAMWLEADCNLIGGESMVRQIIHGKRFFKEEFGVNSHVLWLPDVFGYSAALPQILKKCGVDNFVTSKISWNQTNKMPYDTFYWEGIDGTEIFTNFITTQDSKFDGQDNMTTYVGHLNPSHVLGTWLRYQQKEYNNETVLTYGYGDGGGGPTADMLENGRRLSYGLPGFPKTVQSCTTDYLDKVKKNFDRSAEQLKRSPKWVGELYLEAHRGTYTSITKNKKNNRESEFLLQRAEGLSAIANRLLGKEYAEDVFYRSWQTVLLNQFHDIIPGSSIKEVYEDCDKDYQRVRDDVTAELQKSLYSISQNIKTDGGVMLYNSTGFSLSGVAEIDGKRFETPKLPPYGWTVVDPKTEENRVKIHENTAENDYYILSLDAAGRIERLYDKSSQREVLLRPANELRIFEDRAWECDNWEVPEYYREKMWVLDDNAKITPFSNEVGGGYTVEKNYLGSTIKQTVQLYNKSRLIEVKNELDWHEEHQILKIAFPLDIHTNSATFEIQYGNLSRPTHRNTSWDTAKFEVCGHKWVDLSEDGYGVSLLNDCKYGYSVEGSELELTALKCGTNPNPDADKGHHEFRFALLPHAGDFREGGTVREAYGFNNRPVAVALNKQDGKLPETFSALSVDCDNIVIETVKNAYNGEGTVVRLYDAFDRRGTVRLTAGFPVKKALLCDMLENELEELPVNENAVEIPIKNFEIATVKLL